jgi:CRISPR-associated protein Csb1
LCCAKLNPNPINKGVFNMSKIDFSALSSAPRLLLEADLKPLQGDRFQPTGFADLGAARYRLADRTEMLLVESPQSVANCLEKAVFDDAKGDLIDELKGLPYVKITINSKEGALGTTSTLQEAHRLNSGYLWGIEPSDAMAAFRAKLREEFGMPTEGKKPKAAKGKKGATTSAADTADASVATGEEGDSVAGALDLTKIIKAIFKYDTNTVLHGAFLEKVAGRIRFARAISGFIEARNVNVAANGGVKNDHVDPKGEAKFGFGNVPFTRTEFTAERITAYLNLDLALLRGYRLGDDATDLLIALALLKVRRFLETGLRLRTACDLDVVGEVRVRPSGFTLPTTAELLAAMPDYIAACKGMFADPAITEVSGRYEKKAKADKAAAKATETTDAQDEGGDDQGAPDDSSED